jgi:hypothetical protein
MFQAARALLRLGILDEVSKAGREGIDSQSLANSVQ